MWKRKMECGHCRDTYLMFFMNNYNKPKVGDYCFCRECCKESKIIKVTKVSEKRNPKYYEWARYFRKQINSPSKPKTK